MFVAYVAFQGLCLDSVFVSCTGEGRDCLQCHRPLETDRCCFEKASLFAHLVGALQWLV